jgi:hypothetical protein
MHASPSPRRTIPPLSLPLRLLVAGIAQLSFAVALFSFVGLVAPSGALRERYAALPLLRWEDAFRTGFLGAATIALGLALRRAPGRASEAAARLAGIAAFVGAAALADLALAAATIATASIEPGLRPRLFGHATLRALAVLVAYAPLALALVRRRTQATASAAWSAARFLGVGTLTLTLLARWLAK